MEKKLKKIADDRPAGLKVRENNKKEDGNKGRPGTLLETFDCDLTEIAVCRRSGITKGVD